MSEEIDRELQRKIRIKQLIASLTPEAIDDAGDLCAVVACEFAAGRPPRLLYYQANVNAESIEADLDFRGDCGLLASLAHEAVLQEFGKPHTICFQGTFITGKRDSLEFWAEAEARLRTGWLPEITTAN